MCSNRVSLSLTKGETATVNSNGQAGTSRTHLVATNGVKTRCPSEVVDIAKL